MILASESHPPIFHPSAHPTSSRSTADRWSWSSACLSIRNGGRSLLVNIYWNSDDQEVRTKTDTSHDFYSIQVDVHDIAQHELLISVWSVWMNASMYPDSENLFYFHRMFLISYSTIKIQKQSRKSSSIHMLLPLNTTR